MNEESKAGKLEEGEKRSSAPSISLPKGGGAIRGIGEKFAANPVTGTGSLSVPIATSPGRSGFGPQLSLSYDSGSGNGPFGFGWSLSLPSITRKTDKGLPKYQDAEESDEFILSGAEDLVPVLIQNAQGDWVREELRPRTVDGKIYAIQRYRPRIEGLFARIERWTNQSDPADVFWRSISRDNITTWYGKTTESRISDPDNAARIFSWLICESHDDKGNAIVYKYEAEDSHVVELAQAHERNRSSKSRSANRYLKRIKYGNRVPYFPVLVEDQPPTPLPTEWLFTVVFDYDERHYEALELDPNLPADAQHRLVRASAASPSSSTWAIRPDPFSAYRAGFEVRTYRRCQRVLMFHHFDEIGEEPYLVRSTEFGYQDLDYQANVTLADELSHIGSTRFLSCIQAVTQSGYVREETKPIEEREGIKYVTYIKKSLPPLEFEYSRAIIQEKLEPVDAESLENLPQGLDGAQYQWADLDGEGAGGILTEQNGAWFYKRNLSPLPIENENGQLQLKARFGPAERISTLPSLSSISSGAQQILDFAGDGQVDVVTLDDPVSGFFERTMDGDWQPFKSFSSMPNIAFKDPNLKFVDLTGDGHADIFVTEDEVFTWYPSLAEAGFGPAQKVRQLLDEEQGPRLVFADGTQSIYLSDMSGDGLTDLVRIRNGEVSYWPNLGYCHFGAKVTMDNAPCFDKLDQFDQRRIRLADIDGTGVTDILYITGNGVHIYFNQSGNCWTNKYLLDHVPAINNTTNVMAVDLLGNGTACLVWSSPLPTNKRAPMRYVDLMGGQKPHLLTKVVNNLGPETHVHYAPSTKFYLKDKEAGREWITRLHFPVHVVERVETYDHISRNRFVTRYAYHHGYFDGVEREFRGFGMVEQWDTEEFKALSASQEFPVGINVDERSHVPPVLTKTWFHTGAYLGRNRISNFFAGLLNHTDTGEYFREPELRDNDLEASKYLLEDTVLPDSWNIEEEREACRALKGSMLRQEVYALDGSDKQPYPYTVTEQNFTIRRVQAKAGNPHGVFFAHPCEAINYHYERDPDDPRVSHTLTLAVDDYGNVLRSVAVGYRRRPGPNLQHAEQAQTHFTFTENRVANRPDESDWYRIGLPVQARTYEIVNPPDPVLSGSRVVPFRFETIRNTIEALWPEGQPEPDAAKLWPYENWDWRRKPAQRPPDTRLRLIEHVRTLYRKDDLTDFLPLASDDPMLPNGIQSLALPGESFKLAFTPELLTQIYQRPRDGQPPENLLPTPADVLGRQGADQGGYLLSQDLKGAGWFPNTDPDDYWWLPSDRVFLSTDADVANPASTAAQELAEARQHFFLPRKYADPFGQSTTVDYDGHDLLIAQTKDALSNSVTAQHDYHVLQPKLVTDPNGNRSFAAFDALGLVVATAVAGKETEDVGDSLEDFEQDTTLRLANPTLADIQGFVDDLRGQVAGLLKRATTRIVYDLDRYRRCEIKGVSPRK